MIKRDAQTAPATDAGRFADRQAKLTLFAIPKQFAGQAGLIQRNAIRSWALLKPHVEIVLFGQDDPGLTEIAEEVGAKLFPMRSNELGTPILSDAFAMTQEYAAADIIGYANCDIIFDTGLLDVLESLSESSLDRFLAIGQRTDLVVDTEIAADDFDAVRQLICEGQRRGVLDSIVCKDFFLFPRGAISNVPEFLVGRGNWDNWMVATAKRNGIPVVDVTAQLVAIHQNHDHAHVAGGRKNAYVFGEEARHNQRLAEGRNLISGSVATWQLSEKGLKKRGFPMISMVSDLPRFMRLIRKLLFLGYLLAATAFSV